MDAKTLPLLTTLLLAGACRSGGAQIPYHLTGRPGVVTRVNLHPDEARARLYSTNYLQPGLIPRCTPVTIDSVGAKRMRFTVGETGRTYTWNFQKRLMVEPIEVHLDKFFGKQCPDDSGFSELDQKGIRNGEVYVGMTRAGVLAAVGYPPTHETPNLEMDAWKYWLNRFNTRIIQFEGDTVANIQD